MGFFEAIAASSFTTDSEGRRLFFPWGVLGKGYLIPTDAEYQHLRVTLIRTYQILIPTTVLLIVLLQRWMPWPPLVLLLPFCLGYPVWVRRVTARWSQSAEHLSIRQSMTNQAQHQSRFVLWFFLICQLAFIAAGFGIIADLHKWSVGAVLILFSGFGAVVFCWMLVAQRRIQRSGGIGRR